MLRSLSAYTVPRAITNRHAQLREPGDDVAGEAVRDPPALGLPRRALDERQHATDARRRATAR